MKRTLGEAARTLGAELRGEDRAYAQVSTDSRTLGAGALFVALQGPNFDGTEFTAAAAARGAAGAIVPRTPAAALPYIVVPDTLAALQNLAGSWRAQFDLPLVGVAGSNGKTTVKEMTAAILSTRGPCLATLGNLNNHIGVPLTLLRLEAMHRAAVVEVGANRIGDVAELMRLVRPTVGVITNAGAEHLEGFGSLDGVAQGEGEMVAHLDRGAAAVINADDAYAGYWRGLARGVRLFTYGMRDADFTACDVLQGIDQGEFMTRFTLECGLGRARIALKTGGAHNIANALAAAAAAAAVGASLADIVAGLEAFRSVSGRLQLKPGARGSWIIDDSYNANPSSVLAGLQVLKSLHGPTWLVLGDMAELGAHSVDSHADVGVQARDAGVTRLFALGAQSRLAAESFGPGAEWFADADSLTARLNAELSAGVTVLVKGSRINRLERVVRALSGGGAPDQPVMMAG